MVANFKYWPELDFVQQEEFSSLCTNINLCGKDIKVIEVASSDENEGKTHVSMELFRRLSSSGKKVILIDADLRKSAIIRRYCAIATETKCYGLSNYLCGQVSLEDVIFNVSNIGGDIIFSGECPPNPNFLLDNKLFDELIEKLRDIYDYIIIDVPPINVVTDGTIIAKRCDGVVFVVYYGKISYRYAQVAKQQIEKTNTRILGAVLNGAEKNDARYSRYGYKHGYYRGYRKYGYSNKSEDTVK